MTGTMRPWRARGLARWHRLIAGGLLAVALAGCAPLGQTPDVKVRPTSVTPALPVAAAATLTPPPPIALPSPTPPPPTPQPNRRITEVFDLGQLSLSVTRVQRFRGVDRCPGDSQALEVEYRFTNRSQETLGVDFIDSTVLDSQGRTLRPASIQLREVRDVLPGYSERMAYLFCVLPDSTNLTLIVAPATYRGFERLQGPRAIVELEPTGTVLPLLPRITPAPTAPPR